MPRYSSDLQKKAAADAQRVHGLYGIKEYRAWNSMKRRCFNPNCVDWKNYGGRGITVCKKWCDSFVAFLNDVGYAPSPAHTLDRKNNEGNYHKRNVKWSTRSEQNRNTRRQYGNRTL